MPSRKSALRLRDIIEDVGRIETFIAGMTFEDFVADERTLFAVERLLQRIAEAAVQIDADDATMMGPELPVMQMRALGNRLRHEYRVINHAIVFEIATTKLSELRTAAQLALENDG